MSSHLNFNLPTYYLEDKAFKLLCLKTTKGVTCCSTTKLKRISLLHGA